MLPGRPAANTSVFGTQLFVSDCLCVDGFLAQTSDNSRLELMTLTANAVRVCGVEANPAKGSEAKKLL